MHMDAGRCKTDYRAAADSLRHLLDLAPLGSVPFVSVDGNDSLNFEPRSPSIAVGPFVCVAAGWKSSLLRAALAEYGLFAANMWIDNGLGPAMCLYTQDRP